MVLGAFKLSKVVIDSVAPCFYCHYIKAQNSPEALYNRVFGPKSLKLGVLRALGLVFRGSGFRSRVRGFDFMAFLRVRNL